MKIEITLTPEELEVFGLLAKRSHTLLGTELSVRARNVLKRMGISTLEDLRATAECDFLSTKNCGKATFREIMRMVNPPQDRTV